MTITPTHSNTVQHIFNTGTVLNYKNERIDKYYQFKIEGVIDPNANTYFARNAKDGTPVKVKLYGSGSASQMPKWHHRASDFNSGYIIYVTFLNWSLYGFCS